MDNTALLQNVGERASQAGAVAENALLGVADRVAEAAFEVGNLVQDAANSRRPPTHRKGGFGLVLLVLIVGGALFFLWRRRSQSSELSDDGMPPYPSDPSDGQKTIDEAAKRMGSTGQGTSDPRPDELPRSRRVARGARRTGVES